MLEFVNSDANQQKGEFVLLIEGAPKQQDASQHPNQQELDHMLKIMLAELPLKQAAQLVAKVMGLKKNFVYQRALELK